MVWEPHYLFPSHEHKLNRLLQSSFDDLERASEDGDQNHVVAVLGLTAIVAASWGVLRCPQARS